MTRRWSFLVTAPALLLSVALAQGAPAKSKNSPSSAALHQAQQAAQAQRNAKAQQAAKAWKAKAHAINVRAARERAAQARAWRVKVWTTRLAQKQTAQKQLANWRAFKAQQAAQNRAARARMVAVQAHNREIAAARAQQAHLTQVRLVQAKAAQAKAAQAKAAAAKARTEVLAKQNASVARPVAVATPGFKPQAAPTSKPQSGKPIQAVLKPVATPLPAPPTAQVYATFAPGLRFSGDQPMVPLSFLSGQVGASAGKVQDASGAFYRIEFFGQRADVYPYQVAARFNNAPVSLPVAPQVIDNELYLPWTPLATLFGVKWSVSSGDTGQDAQTTLLLQYQAAYIQSVRHSSTGDRLRVVVTLSGPTRITAAQEGANAVFHLAAARTPGLPAVYPLQDVLGKRVGIDSGGWKASVKVPLNYRAPIRWFTLGSPPRIVIDAQRIFNEQQNSPITEQMRLTSIRKGTADGPVQMWVARCDPRDGWRVQIAPAGYGAFTRAPTSHIASRHSAPLAVNGGFFATDGAAVGAVLVNGEWIRLPWRGRTAIGFRPDGTARIDNLQAQARVTFSNGLVVPVRNLNGWPDAGTISVMTARFGPYYKLRPGEYAVEVRDGVVVAKPGSGGTDIATNGFTLVANGEGAKQWFTSIARGQTAKLQVDAIGWEGFTTALGGGPRLVNNGRIEVTAIREAFRTDVRVGRGPRTAIGIDKQGRYIIVVVDGRRPGYSIGMTLYELAATMQQLGAVDAVNLDGGGSTALAVRSRLVNHPSDGFERRVANALLVTK